MCIARRGIGIAGVPPIGIAVARGIDLKTVSGAHLDEVVGSTAVTDLPAGSLLVAGSYGPAGLAEGQSRVGLKLAAGRLPTRCAGLAPTS